MIRKKDIPKIETKPEIIICGRHVNLGGKLRNCTIYIYTEFGSGKDKKPCFVVEQDGKHTEIDIRENIYLDVEEIKLTSNNEAKLCKWLRKRSNIYKNSSNWDTISRLWLLYNSHSKYYYLKCNLSGKYTYYYNYITRYWIPEGHQEATEIYLKIKEKSPLEGYNIRIFTEYHPLYSNMEPFMEIFNENFSSLVSLIDNRYLKETKNRLTSEQCIELEKFMNGIDSGFFGSSTHWRTCINLWDCNNNFSRYNLRKIIQPNYNTIKE